jgi:hypothetical protein
MPKLELKTFLTISMIVCCLRWISPQTTHNDGFAVDRAAERPQPSRRTPNQKGARCQKVQSRRRDARCRRGKRCGGGERPSRIGHACGGESASPDGSTRTGRANASPDGGAGTGRVNASPDGSTRTGRANASPDGGAGTGRVSVSSKKRRLSRSLVLPYWTRSGGASGCATARSSRRRVLGGRTAREAPTASPAPTNPKNWLTRKATVRSR